MRLCCVAGWIYIVSKRSVNIFSWRNSDVAIQCTSFLNAVSYFFLSSYLTWINLATYFTRAWCVRDRTPCTNEQITHAFPLIVFSVFLNFLRITSVPLYVQMLFYGWIFGLVNQTKHCSSRTRTHHLPFRQYFVRRLLLGRYMQLYILYRIY